MAIDERELADAPVQMEFEDFEGMRVNLTKATCKSLKLEDVGALKSGDKVRIQVEGRVTWVNHGPEETAGQLQGIRLHIIEPLSARITEIY